MNVFVRHIKCSTPSAGFGVLSLAGSFSLQPLRISSRPLSFLAAITLTILLFALSTSVLAMLQACARSELT